MSSRAHMHIIAAALKAHWPARCQKQLAPSRVIGWKSVLALRDRVRERFQQLAFWNA